MASRCRPSAHADARVYRRGLRSRYGADLAQRGMSYGGRDASRSSETAGSPMNSYSSVMLMVLAVPMALRIGHAIVVLSLSRDKVFRAAGPGEQMRVQVPYKPVARVQRRSAIRPAG